MNELNELRKLVGECKRAIIRIISLTEHHEIHVPGTGDLEQLIGTLHYMRGYIDCLESKMNSISIP